MQILVDKSLIEAFVNGQACARWVPSSPDALGIDLFAEGDAVFVNEACIWKLKPVWPTHE